MQYISLSSPSYCDVILIVTLFKLHAKFVHIFVSIYRAA